MRALGLAALLFTLPVPAAALHPDDLLPSLAGPTLSGPSLELPAAPGHAALVIFSFSRSAGRDARLWNERFSRDFPEDGPAYLVLELESVPRLVRGRVVSAIRNGMPLRMQGRAIILDHDEATWRSLLEVSEDRRAHLVLLDAGGRIAWRNGGAFTEVEYRRMKAVLDFSRASRPPAPRTAPPASP